MRRVVLQTISSDALIIPPVRFHGLVLYLLASNGLKILSNLGAVWTQSVEKWNEYHKTTYHSVKTLLISYPDLLKGTVLSQVSELKSIFSNSIIRQKYTGDAVFVHVMLLVRYTLILACLFHVTFLIHMVDFLYLLRQVHNPRKWGRNEGKAYVQF